MRRWILLILLAASCTKTPLFPGRPRYSTEAGGGFSHHRQESGNGQIPEERHLFTTAVCFPKDFDWQRDTVPVGNGSFILLLQDGAELLRIPAGSSVSPSRHRAREGHLWTDRCIDGKTIISRDGVDILSWDKEESLKGFLLRDGDVFTLGQRLGGKGISLRRNGEILFEDSSGTVLGESDDGYWEGGALAFDGDKLCYCYSRPVNVGGNVLSEYRFMNWDKAVNTMPAGSFRAIYDWRSIGGIQCRSEMRQGGDFCLVIDDTYHSIAVRGIPHIGKLYPWQGSVMVALHQDFPYCFWAVSTSGAIKDLATWNYVSELYTDGENAALVQTAADGRVINITSPRHPDPARLMAGNYRLMSPACGTVDKACFAIGLTNLDGGKHLLCVDNTVAELNFNGYISSVRIE